MQKSNFKKELEINKNEKRLGIHSFHRYYGKLIPAIPQTAIKLFTKKNDWVCDPFSGSGTTAVETLKLERNFMGIEINPLSLTISSVKTNNYDVNILSSVLQNILINVKKDKSKILEKNKPYCVNRDHWFASNVQNDLVKIKRNLNKSVIFIESKQREKYIKFATAVLSAIVKQVSFADVQHVFPGFSKRMHRLQNEGKLNYDVIKIYERAFKKRITYIQEYGKHKTKCVFYGGDTSQIKLPNWNNKISLIVTNPPYISSVRYAETLKLELYWMGICNSSKEYMTLANSMIGDDHIKKSSVTSKPKLTKYLLVNKYIKMVFKHSPAQAITVYNFFSKMEKVIILMNKLLKRHGKVVMKIGNSKVRKINIPTGKLLSEIAQKQKFNTLTIMTDKINPNSRSLTTARNTYSDIILEDNIVIWEKK